MAEADQTHTERHAQPELGSHSGTDVTASYALLEKVLGHPLSESKLSPHMLDCMSRIALLRYVGPPKEEEVDLADDKLYDSSSKGDASWTAGGPLETADGWIITTGPVKRHFYPSVKAIDLVRWFIDCHVQEQEMAKQLDAEEKKKSEKVANLLEIPNPRLPRKKSKNRKSKKNRNQSKHRKEPFPFLDLPIEIRRMVYSFAIGDGRALIHGSHPNKEYSNAKAAWKPEGELVTRPRYRLSHWLDNDDIFDHTEIQAALMLVSKQVHIEAEPFLYSQLTFCFDSINVLHKFFNHASKEGIKNIKKLELHHEGYGNPKSRVNRRFKTLHDTKWRQACERVGATLPALSWLKLSITLHDSPLNLKPTARWWRILLRLIGPDKRLNHAHVTLLHDQADTHALASAARKLEDAMMTDRGRRVRDDHETQLALQRVRDFEGAQRKWRRSLPPVQARSVLAVRINEGSSSSRHEADSVTAAEKKYYTSKTQGFARKLSYGDLRSLWR